ncbi:hypothetical protein OIU76_024813 [Salix suchowensis]|uniref:Transmembrane protein n=1 Tax=Salix suchowensis TaxID=1278906 RepID=A0ABQ9AYU1_9ROSI|nr:hypothetical protein OIU76_024813 [Salix suchowensis]KAJ6365976.1 hypothetical protein OIU77_002527 [Salix suchowensis]
MQLSSSRLQSSSPLQPTPPTFPQTFLLLSLSLQLLVRIQFGIIEIIVVFDVIFIVEFFVELVRIGVVVVAISVVVRNGVGFFFEETKILIQRRRFGVWRKRKRAERKAGL